MSVDISQLTARLDPQRQEAVKQQYEERATSPTAAFLLCFFLGSAGAHRFYLREWRVAFGHLALFVVGVAALVAGLIQTLPLTVKLASNPVGATLDALGVLLLLIALIWEIVDLGRIDHQVYQRNLLLAEGIIAGTLLADHTVVDETLRRLESTSQRARAQAQAASAPTAAAAPTPAAGVAAATAASAAAGAGIITASEVEDARKLAEESAGTSTISYAEVSRFDVSADPDQARAASAEAAHEGNWTESDTTTESQPGATADAAATPVVETVTRTHTEEGPRVTDSYEVDRVAGPSALAAGLGAAALGTDALETDHAASFDEPTQPDLAPIAEPAASATMPSSADATDAAPAYPAYVAHSVDATDAALAAPVVSAASAGAYDFERDDIGDVTDANMPAVVVRAADVALPNASPAYVQLPQEQVDAYTSMPPEEPVAPLYLIPEEPTTQEYVPAPEPAAPAAFAPIVEEPPADAYVPPVASVYSAPTEAPVAATPSWDQPTFTPPAPEPQPANNDTLAELAGFGALAGAGALAGEALAQSHPAPEATPEPAPAVAAPEPPKTKKIRVRRKVVVDGQVVAEEVVEREIPADKDMAEAARDIQAELGHLTPEQIAQRAHLAPGEEVELRQRTEGPGGGQ